MIDARAIDEVRAKARDWVDEDVALECMWVLIVASYGQGQTRAWARNSKNAFMRISFENLSKFLGNTHPCTEAKGR